jgi:hypothetical protein
MKEEFTFYVGVDWVSFRQACVTLVSQIGKFSQSPRSAEIEQQKHNAHSWCDRAVATAVG